MKPTYKQSRYHYDIIFFRGVRIQVNFMKTPCPCATTKRTFDSLIYSVSPTSNNQQTVSLCLCSFFLGTDTFIRGKPGSWRSNMWDTDRPLYFSKQVFVKFYLSLKRLARWLWCRQMSVITFIKLYPLFLEMYTQYLYMKIDRRKNWPKAFFWTVPCIDIILWNSMKRIKEWKVSCKFS